MTDREAAAKEWLNRNEELREEIRVLEMRLEEMRASVNKSVGAPEEIKVQTQPQNNQAEKIADIVDFEKKIDEKRLYYKLLEEKTIETIDRLRDPNKRILLHLRYVHRRSWKYIADKMHLTEAYIYEFHRKALNSLYSVIDWRQ